MVCRGNPIKAFAVAGQKGEVRLAHDLEDDGAGGSYAFRLRLFLLQNREELSIGRYQILEPRPELRSVPEKRVTPAELDLVMVPGVAFDRSGGRMGHGLGYYDRLL